MDKNNLAHTTWECKYYLVFEAGLLAVYYLKSGIKPVNLFTFFLFP